MERNKLIPADVQKCMNEIKFGQLWARHSLLVNKLDVGKYRIDMIGLKGAVAEVLSFLAGTPPVKGGLPPTDPILNDDDVKALLPGDLNLAVIGHGEPEKAPTGPRWVRAVDFKHEVGMPYNAKDSRSKGAGSFDESGIFKWGDDSLTLPDNQGDLLILDESPEQQSDMNIPEDNSPKGMPLPADDPFKSIMNHDNIIANQLAGMSLEEAIFQHGYSSGHDVGYERGKREATGPRWVRGIPTEHKPYFARVESVLVGGGIYDAIITPIENTDHWWAYGCAFRFSLHESRIIEYLDESNTPEQQSDAVAFGDWLATERWQPRINTEWARYETIYSDVSVKTTAELYDIFKNINREKEMENEFVKATDTVTVRMVNMNEVEKLKEEHADLNLALAAMLNGYQNLSMYQKDWFTVPKDLIDAYTKMVLEYEQTGMGGQP